MPAPARPTPPRRTPQVPGDLIADGVACAKCGYALKGLRVGGSCPECGTPIPQPPPSTRPTRAPEAAAPRPKSKKPTLGDFLPDDFTCGHCKYSLKGLRSGGRCPECGTPIAYRARRHRLEDNLTDAFPHYLKTLAIGCWLMFAGALLTGCLLMVVRAVREPALGAAAGITGVFWWLGVWIVTRPRETSAVPRTELENEWLRCRWAARLTQIGWSVAGLGACGTILSSRAAMAAAAMAVLPYTPTATVRAFESITYLGHFAGLVGLVPLCIVVANLADWAGHSALGDRFRYSAYLVTFGTIAAALTLPVVMARKTALFGPAAFTAFTIAGFGWLSFAVGMLLLLFALARLAGMSLWAIHNAETRAESDRRIAIRQHEFAEELAARSAKAGATPAPPPVNPVQGHGTRAKPGHDDRPIYALEPEEPEPDPR